MHAGAKRKRWHIRPHAINGAIETKSRPPLAGDALFFSGRRREEIDLTKVRSTQANSGL
jgi:hypothetical protein